MPRKPSRQQLRRRAGRNTLRNRNLLIGGAVVGTALALAGAYLANSSNPTKTPAEIGGTNLQTYTYSDGQPGFEWPTVWGNSSVDPEVEVLPAAQYNGGSSEGIAVRDENDDLIGCNIENIQVSDNFSLQERNNIIKKEAFHAAICNELAAMGILVAHDSHGLYEDQTDAGLVYLQPLIDARAAVALMAADREFSDSTGFAGPLVTSLTENYEYGKIDCGDIVDYNFLMNNGNVAAGPIPQGNGLPVCN